MVVVASVKLAAKTSAITRCIPVIPTTEDMLSTRQLEPTVSYTAPDGEIHRADVVTTSGIVIECQHCQMIDEERLSREHFYKNLVWVLDGKAFRHNFDIYHPLPHPASELARDFVWFKATRSMKGAAGGIFLRLSEGILEDPNATKARCGPETSVTSPLRWR